MTVPQLDQQWFLSQFFWVLAFFIINVILHYTIIIPMFQRGILELMRKKDGLRKRMQEIGSTISSNEIKITEIEIEQENYISEITLRARQDADFELAAKLLRLKNSLKSEKEEMSYRFLEHKKSFVTNFSSSIMDISDIISKKMENK